MMENSRYSLLEDKRFKEELDECYFHPSRKYASEEIKFIARNAGSAVWNGCKNARKHERSRKRRNHCECQKSSHK